YKKDKSDNRRWILREFCLKTQGAYFINFETFVRKTPGGRKYYLDYDDHWSPEGHAVAARLLLERMAFQDEK
ncbi:MAG: SGNH/GDSL hydrolase family protein, partial [Deltaproteobacteria bacterium]|nr:SGNH/GDSL hydrolase family protein [Deltaproteobacteria bacterium]